MKSELFPSMLDLEEVYFADPISQNGKLNQLLANFGMEIHSSYLYSTDIGINSSITIDVANIENLPYMSGTNIFTDQSVNEILYTGTAINISNTVGEGIFLSQEADLYPIINLTGNYFIDVDNDGLSSDGDKILESAVVQAGLELQRGGRLIVTASGDMMNASYIAEKDNKYLFLRQMQWLMKLQNAINFDNYEIEETEITEGDSISVSVSALGDNETVLTDLIYYLSILLKKTNLSLLIIRNLLLLFRW